MLKELKDFCCGLKKIINKFNLFSANKVCKEKTQDVEKHEELTPEQKKQQKALIKKNQR